MIPSWNSVLATHSMYDDVSTVIGNETPFFRIQNAAPHEFPSRPRLVLVNSLMMMLDCLGSETSDGLLGCCCKLSAVVSGKMLPRLPVLPLIGLKEIRFRVAAKNGLLAQQHPTTFQSTLKENNIYVGSKHTAWTISNLVSVDSVKKHIK